MRKICFITGTRAEYGLLRPIMALVRDSGDCVLQIIATNMHLLAEYGETYREIEADGFTIDAKVPMTAESDSAEAVVASMATEMAGMNEAIARLRPDIAVILGDRYEMLVAATVCLMHRVPVAHIHGGEISEGAYDDSIRHAITKLSALHFTSTEDYRRRVVQMGEQPERVLCVGAPGVENVATMALLSRDELAAGLGLSLSRPFLLVTYHPETLARRTAEEAIADFLSALDAAAADYDLIFTLPNSDEGHGAIAAAIRAYCEANPRRAVAFKALGARRYLSLMRLAAAVVGNSSSGILEAPSAGVPTLNIGDRQKGRVRAASVVDVAADSASIAAGLRKVLSDDFREAARTVSNPYAKAGTAKAIADALRTADLAALRTKPFYDLPR